MKAFFHVHNSAKSAICNSFMKLAAVLQSACVHGCIRLLLIVNSHSVKAGYVNIRFVTDRSRVWHNFTWLCSLPVRKHLVSLSSKAAYTLEAFWAGRACILSLDCSAVCGDGQLRLIQLPAPLPHFWCTRRQEHTCGLSLFHGSQSAKQALCAMQPICWTRLSCKRFAKQAHSTANLADLRRTFLRN